VAIFYASGVVFGVSAALFIVRDLVLVLTGQLSDDELIITQESEEMTALEAQQAHADVPDAVATARR
jgi:TRAP-type C4-dicarboxylate transport system permease small subunit